MSEEANNLRLVGDVKHDASPSLADFVQARLKPAAQTYWTALFGAVAVPWNDAYSKALAMLCELLAERDELVDAIERTSSGETGLAVGQKGEDRRHPLSTRLNQVESEIFSQMKAFGMTPAGLARIQHSQGGTGGKLNSLADLIGG